MNKVTKKFLKKLKKKFGIDTIYTTHEYVMWLDCPEGVSFLKSIEVPNHNFGNYWTMHEAKSCIITAYAEYLNELII